MHRVLVFIFIGKWQDTKFVKNGRTDFIFIGKWQDTKFVKNGRTDFFSFWFTYNLSKDGVFISKKMRFIKKKRILYVKK